MSFSADIVAVKTKYDQSMIWPTIQIMNQLLASNFGIKIRGEISFDQYLRESASKPINRYLRMPLDVFKKLMPHSQAELSAIVAKKAKGNKGKEDTVDVVYDAGRNESHKFANSRHFVVNFSTFENYTLIWFNFHPALYDHLPGFQNIHNIFTRAVSIKYNTEAVYMHTTSISRSDASFIMYSSGNMRGSENGKDALTVLKNDYAIDVNKCMDNVDNNIAIFYAPFDLASITKQIYDQNKRFEEFQKVSDDLIVKDKETGENMIAKFMKDNDEILKTLQSRKDRVTEAMMVEGFGTLVFLELDKEPIKINNDLKSETFFGRKR